MELSIALPEDDPAELRALARRLTKVYIPDSTVELRNQKPGQDELGGISDLVLVLGSGGTIAAINAIAKVLCEYIRSHRKSIKVSVKSKKVQAKLDTTFSGEAPPEVAAIIDALTRLAES
jgi:hypothetical protein